VSPLDILRDIFYLPIFNVLMFLYWVVRDFGLSIVLLTVMVRLALVPLTFKQLHSQRKMMEIQPKIAALKAEYKDDQQGFARAQMQLMKENNVSVFGGCLPLLVQLPFLYGLFYALSAGLKPNPGETLAQHVARINGDLYPFMQFAHVTMPGGTHPLNTMLEWFSWLPWHPVLDLAVPDPTHLLPILAALLTFIQVRMIQGIRKAPQPAPGADAKAIATQNAQQQTMSLMTYVTPVITLVIGLSYAAGLSLYWTVGTAFAIGQQYFIYGWGGLFKGIPRLDEWAAQKNAQREARREAKMVAKGIISAPTVVESTLAPANGASKNGAKRKDWIDQAKADNGQTPKSKERPSTARPFPTLMKTKETTPASTASGETPNGNGATTNGTKATTGATSKNSASGKVTPAKGASTTTTPKAGTPPSQRKVPPGSGTLPKPKGGKK
jgi:YidC/Oxa1 family membrane protein insertase